MKHIAFFLVLLLLCVPLSGCMTQAETADIVATTLPVYQFTSIICQGTGLTVTRLVNESVSCLHDYSLNVGQVKAVEAADLVILNGAGMEDFMEDLLHGKQTIDASERITLLESCHSHEHDDHGDHGHSHEADSHIWLSPANAMRMANTICAGLQEAYPQYANIFINNLVQLLHQLQQLQDYGNAQLSQLSTRELITFHDGFAYFADCFDLHILAAVEEESGSEASAKELIALIEIVEHHHLQVIFTEENGAVSAAKTISAETGAKIYTLNMAMAGDDYFAAMYHNIDTIKEAMG